MRLLAAIFLLFPMVTQALSLQEAFDTLKKNEISYEAKGTICEQVANLVVSEEYPFATHEIVNGITYSNLERVIGELDVVVIDKDSQLVKLVAEVKCWKDLNQAQVKAEDQRTRFQKHLRSGKDLWISLQDREFEKSQFQQAKFISISNKLTGTAGFDLELPFTMQELMRLRRSLFQCFEQNLCDQKL